MGASLGDSLASLAPFALDALTLDAREADPSDLDTARHAASLVVARLRSGHTPGADFRLVLRRERDALVWIRHEAADAAD